jgi:hypothetical protein
MYIPKGRTTFQMAIKYTDILTFFSQIYPNEEFWYKKYPLATLIRSRGSQHSSMIELRPTKNLLLLLLRCGRERPFEVRLGQGSQCLPSRGQLDLLHRRHLDFRKVCTIFKAKGPILTTSFAPQ